MKIKIILVLYTLIVVFLLTGAIYPGSFWRLFGNDITYNEGKVIIGETLEINKIGTYAGQTEVNVNSDLKFISGKKLYMSSDKKSYFIYDTTSGSIKIYQDDILVFEFK